MLMEFRTKNFKNFKKELDMKLGNISNYGFSEKAIKNGIVKNALIYGINGSGKTNLGYAVMDITLHLVDKKKHLEQYRPYLNLETAEPVSFFYKFKFGENILEYSYQKDSPITLLKEEVLINGKEVLFYDYTSHDSRLSLKGAETLNIDLTDKNISFIKYVYSNTVLVENNENMVFYEFLDFVDNMLLFSSLERNQFTGFSNETEGIAERIIESGKLKEFETFLNEAGIPYRLKAKTVDGEKKIYCVMGKKDADFYSIASKGTTSLALFFFWLIQLEDVSLVFIDEFDAFYHNDLSKRVVQKLLQIDDTQAILTTHNTDIMTNDLLRPDCYLQIVDGTIKSFADSTDKEIRKAHNLQKMYKGGVFDQNE